MDPEETPGLSMTLREAGHTVFAAYDGAAALELFVHLRRTHLLITNTDLGAVDAPELMRQVRRRRPDMPILHVIRKGDSNAGTPSDVPTVREPFTANQLLTVVGSLLA